MNDQCLRRHQAIVPRTSGSCRCFDDNDEVGKAGPWALADIRELRGADRSAGCLPLPGAALFVFNVVQPADPPTAG